MNFSKQQSRWNKITPCYYSRALKRIINWTVAAWRKYPGRKFFVSKLLVKAAFWHCHLNAETAVQTCTQLPQLGVALMILRLLFGGAPCPSDYGVISESICNLINAIRQHNEWDQNTLFHKEAAQADVPAKESFPDDVPCSDQQDLIIDILVNGKRHDLNLTWRLYWTHSRTRWHR